MPITGRCHCGAVTWRASEEPQRHSLCHCEDCRRWSGAPVVGWAAFDENVVTIEGETRGYQSSSAATREFCARCGTGLFYRSATLLPGILDIQSGTMDDPEAFPPSAQVMVRHRLGWAREMDKLPAFESYPGMD
ncbi:GFA family protein [Sphingomonas sp. MMSM20]|uniref:GFA family protein n=1 Tax=Sphingomonas lycopersici TaxID=2951807 RepID=UPI002237DD95|nr:GFA family protein [Sphingomonas lycopersici]MCW6529676.1 GFA family protein [Sphingomonas lycopersici]